MQRPLVGVVIGGRSDFNVMRRGLETLRVMGVPYIFEVISAHRTPHKLTEFAREAGERGIEVLIAAEGGSALLASHLASHTNLPVIGVPIDASPLRGQDALFSMVMLPPGMPVATVGINNSENAALLAAQILAIKHASFRTVLAHRRMYGAQRTEGVQKELSNEYPDLCLPEKTSPLTRQISENETADDTMNMSESVTPDPPEESDRIRPGAVWVERPAGPAVESLVSTPVPQEPGVARIQTPPPSLHSLVSDPLGQHKNSTRGIPLVPPVSWQSGSDDETPLPLSHPSNGLADLPTPASDQEQEGLATESEELALEDFSHPLEGIATPLPVSDEITPAMPRPVNTKIFQVDREIPSEDLIDHAMMVLLEGGVVALPTDTVYGLAVDATNLIAIDRLQQLKGGEHQKTLGVLIHHPDMLDQLVSEVPVELEKVIEQCWPGALTIILPKHPDALSNIVQTDRIGVRIPSDNLCLSIIERVGRPIVMRNASLSNVEPMNSAEPLIEHYTGLVDCILDGGTCNSEAGASTVLNALGEQFEILREGDVSRKKLKELLGAKLRD